MKNLTIIAGLLLSTVTFGNETATSLAKNGELSISFSSNAVCYSVEWSSDLSKEEWHSLYDKQLIPDGLDDISVDVPMFFRVTTTTTIHDVTNGCAYVPVGLISGRDINGNVFSYEITNNLWVSKYEVTAEDFSVFLQQHWDNPSSSRKHICQELLLFFALVYGCFSSAHQYNQNRFRF